MVAPRCRCHHHHRPFRQQAERGRDLEADLGASLAAGVSGPSRDRRWRSIGRVLRPGNAGSNTAADHVTALEQALESLPALPAEPGRSWRATDSGALRFCGAPTRSPPRAAGRFLLGYPVDTRCATRWKSSTPTTAVSGDRLHATSARACRQATGCRDSTSPTRYLRKTPHPSPAAFTTPRLRHRVHHHTPPCPPAPTRTAHPNTPRPPHQPPAAQPPSTSTQRGMLEIIMPNRSYLPNCSIQNQPSPKQSHLHTSPHSPHITHPHNLNITPPHIHHHPTSQPLPPPSPHTIHLHTPQPTPSTPPHPPHTPNPAAPCTTWRGRYG